jgi:erythronate-4-phosphate dehydrogenase
VIDDACYAYHKIFSEFGEIVAMAGRDIDANSVQDADVLIVRSRTKVNQALLQDSQVKFVGSTVAGLEHVDQDYLTANNITFFSAQGCNSMAVAEFIISAIVNLADELGFDYTQKTLGIIGVGNVGSRLAAKAELMGIKTLLNDPPRQDTENLPEFVELGAALSAVFPTVNNIGFGLYLLPNILNNHTTTRCINDNGLIANMMKILCI